MEINIKNLSKNFRKVKALDNINLDIKGPGMIGLVGPNGAGKSTLMKLLIGQLKASSGSINIDNKNLRKNENYLKERLGYLPQDFGLYDELKVEEFLDYIACLKGIGNNKKKIIEKCIYETNLTEKKKEKIKTLSGGQKQRVGIAQAMLNDPEIFIVDEPTVGLDPEERIKFRNLFSKGASKKIVILSTHIIEDVESICNRLIILNKGKILFDGLPNELVKKSLGHVGIIEQEGVEDELYEKDLKIVSTRVTAKGMDYRVVARNLPPNTAEITPSLEDAYMYCMMMEGVFTHE
ncbi:ATP-binding cassette domain-containing protein [Maledivibacter halophilus]|uniref:ABC-type multidrug transport system, ATPase component n=1 Tax=Maledivibacter halophilus TaxID=36842 RepID=A0A1T5MK05_9FIRM|nr:ATP-binding cassette domain-containing protein [Maledivibacter halophilus]SKC88284.1 ABC-type multidrug transport system, ATPase component [Maledivibacter halophilus]